MDQFGHPVNLTYRGREKFQTSWGGWLTCLFAIFLAWIIIIIIGSAFSQPFQKRIVVKELVDSDTPLTIENPNDLLKFINMDTFTNDDIFVSLDL